MLLQLESALYIWNCFFFCSYEFYDQMMVQVTLVSLLLSWKGILLMLLNPYFSYIVLFVTTNAGT
jgi:hypothetical protein